MTSVFCTLFLTGISLIGVSLWIFKNQKLVDQRDSSLLYAIMHDELSNPLQTVLATLTNVSLSETRGAMIKAEDLEVVKNRLNRLAKVTKDLKTLAAQDNHSVSQQKELIDVAGIVQGIIVDLADTAENNRVRILYEGVESANRILGNRTNIERVIQNLIENGIKYSRADLNKSIVMVSVVCRQGKVFVQVEDNGQGMSSTCLSSLGINPQQKSIKNIDTKGSGIGWLLIKKVVENHKGTISVRSIPDKGTSVELQFACANRLGDFTSQA